MKNWNWITVYKYESWSLQKRARLFILMAILHFQSSLFCNWLELFQFSFSILWWYEICKLTFIAIFVFLGDLTFVRILLILLALIIAQRSTHFLETLSLCRYDQVSLQLEKLCIQCMKLSNINDNHNSHA